jgi:hypothetical protein
MAEASKVVGLERAEPTASELKRTLSGCATLISRERGVIWTVSSVARLLAAADPKSEERQEFYFDGLALILDECGSRLGAIVDDISGPDARQSAVAAS